MGERTALINQLRAVLLERGCALPQGQRKLEHRLEERLGPTDLPLSPRLLTRICCVEVSRSSLAPCWAAHAATPKTWWTKAR